MGNEMGNQNVSGLKEDDNTPVETPEKSLHEAVHEDDLKGENQIIPAAEGKDYHEKVTALDSCDPSIMEDPLSDNNTPDGKEHGETEVKPADASPKVEVESNNAGDEESGIQPSHSSQDVVDHERPIDSKLEENIIETSDPKNQKQISEKLVDSNSENVSETSTDHQIQEEMSTRRETEKEQDDTRTSSFDTNSPPRDSELLESAEPVSDQHELAITHADPSVEDQTGSPQGSKEVQGSNLTGNNDDKCDSLDTETARSLAGSVVSDANLDVEKGEGELLVKMMASQLGEMADICNNQDKFDITDGNEAGILVSEVTSNNLSGSENKSNGELSTEMVVNWNHSPGSPSETILLSNSLKSHEEVSETEDKCITEETKLIRIGSEVSKLEHSTGQLYDECLTAETELIGIEIEANMLDEIPLQFLDELVKESNTTDEASPSESMAIEINHENKRKESVVESPNLASDEHCNDSEGESEMASVVGRVPTKLTVTEREESEEKKIFEERVEIEEDIHAIGEDTEGIEITEESVTQSPEIQQAESLLSQSPAIGSESVQENKMLTVEAMVFTVELEKEKPRQDLSQYNDNNRIAMENIETPAGAEQSNEQCVKDETSVFASGAYEARESMERLRDDQSNSQKLNLPIQIRRSPSFNFDLLVEARAEESDQTPLLYQDKAATRSFSSRIGVNITTPIDNTYYIQDPLNCQAISVGGKAIPHERSDSKKSRTPFLSLMKEEEEAHILVAAKKAPKEVTKSSTDEEAASNSPKRREKRKPRSSLFTSCICCAAMIN